MSGWAGVAADSLGSQAIDSRKNIAEHRNTISASRWMRGRRVEHILKIGHAKTIMQCFRCQFEVAEFAVYCNRCGAQLRARCADCGRVNPRDSHFCDACGRQLRPTAQAARRESSFVTPPPQTLLGCPRCSTVNESGSAYCYSCGLPLDEAQQQQGSPTGEYAPHDNADSGTPTDRLGGFWVRLIAFIVDSFLTFAFSVTIASFTGISVADWWIEVWTSDEPGWGAFDWIGSVTGMVYFSIWVAVWSTTLGKLLFGLEVVRNDGSKVGVGRAFARYWCYLISLSLLGIGFLMIAFRRDKRGLHDLICDTKVVYR